MRHRIHHRNVANQRIGTTLVEVLVVIAIVGLLSLVLLPAVLRSREVARRQMCSSRLRELAISLANHESMQGAYPRGGEMANDGTNGAIPRAHSPLVYLLPHLGQTALFREINLVVPAERYLAISFSPEDPNYIVKRRRVPALLCPSDAQATVSGRNSYRANMGRGTAPHSLWQSGARHAGAFFPPQSALGSRDFPDGLSNTVGFSERLVGGNNPTVYHPERDLWRLLNHGPLEAMSSSEIDSWLLASCSTLTATHGEFVDDSGAYWFYASLIDTWYNHALPPNSAIPDCGVPSGRKTLAIMSARSHHPGGVNAGFMDGRVQFVSDNVSTSVWTSLASRNGSEVSQ